MEGGVGRRMCPQMQTRRLFPPVRGTAEGTEGVSLTNLTRPMIICQRVHCLFTEDYSPIYFCTASATAVSETQVCVVWYPRVNLCKRHHVMQLSRHKKHILLPGYTHTHTHTPTRRSSRTHARTLFCFRAPFSFMWGQSLPVITALISATGTRGEDRCWITTTATTTLSQLCQSWRVAGIWKWLKHAHTHTHTYKSHVAFISMYSHLSCKESWGTSPWGLSSKSP